MVGWLASIVVVYPFAVDTEMAVDVSIAIANGVAVRVKVGADGVRVPLMLVVSVVTFDARIGRKDPPVSGDPHRGAPPEVA